MNTKITENTDGTFTLAIDGKVVCEGHCSRQACLDHAAEIAARRTYSVRIVTTDGKLLVFDMPSPDHLDEVKHDMSNGDDVLTIYLQDSWNDVEIPKNEIKSINYNAQ